MSMAACLAALAGSSITPSARGGGGARRGSGVRAPEPLYVLKLDAERREVVVGPREWLRARHIRLRDVNWLGDEPLEALARTGKDVLARIRSSAPLQPAKLSLEEDGVVGGL